MQRTSPRAPRDLLPGALVDGRYRVVKKLGTGGTSTVYEVEQTRTGGRLALKLLLDPMLAPRLEQEARATAKLKSHHVAHAIDFGNDRGTPYMVMPLLIGQSLRALLTARPKLDLRTTANIVLQLCECLDEAHAIGLVHRDLKPENVHLSAGGPPAAGASAADVAESLAKSTFHVTLLDFGVVKVAQGNDTSQLTRTGSTVGTPYYMSLEQLRGASNVDARADIYSLSVMLYECLAGIIPFSAATLGDLVFAICSAPPLALSTARPELPTEIVDVIMKGLASLPEQRPRTVRDIAREFMPHADPAFSLWLRTEDDDAASQTVQYPHGLSADRQDAAKTLPVAQPAPRPPGPPPPPVSTRAPAEGPVFGGAAAKRVPGATTAMPPIQVPSVADDPSLSDGPTDDEGPTRAGTVPDSILEHARSAGGAMPPPMARPPLTGSAVGTPLPAVSAPAPRPDGAEAPKPGIPRPNPRDRDTPTEMFSPASSAGGLFAPAPLPSQRSLDPADATAILSLPLAATFPEPSTDAEAKDEAPAASDVVEDHPTGRPEAPAQTTPGAALQGSLQGSLGAPEPRALQGSLGAPEPRALAPRMPSFGDAPAFPMGPPRGPSLDPNAVPPSGPWPASFGQDPNVPPPSASFGQPPNAMFAQPPPASAGFAHHAVGAPATAPGGGAGPALDRFLIKVGAAGRSGQMKFRAASPTEQAVVVGVGAAVAAVIVVLFVFFLVRC